MDRRRAQLPLNEGSGYIRRLYSFSRFEQRDEGVYVELEVIALSRDIRGASLADRSDCKKVSRGSLFYFCSRNSAAVRSEAGAANASGRSAALSECRCR